MNLFWTNVVYYITVFVGVIVFIGFMKSFTYPYLVGIDREGMTTTITDPSLLSKRKQLGLPPRGMHMLLNELEMVFVIKNIDTDKYALTTDIENLLKQEKQSLDAQIDKSRAVNANLKDMLQQLTSSSQKQESFASVSSLSAKNEKKNKPSFQNNVLSFSTSLSSSLDASGNYPDPSGNNNIELPPKTPKKSPKENNKNNENPGKHGKRDKQKTSLSLFLNVFSINNSAQKEEKIVSVNIAQDLFFNDEFYKNIYTVSTLRCATVHYIELIYFMLLKNLPATVRQSSPLSAHYLTNHKKIPETVDVSNISILPSVTINENNFPQVCVVCGFVAKMMTEVSDTMTEIYQSTEYASCHAVLADMVPILVKLFKHEFFPSAINQKLPFVDLLNGVISFDPNVVVLLN